MNKKKLLLLLSLVSTCAVVTTVFIASGSLNEMKLYAINRNGESEVWYHYAAVAATETTHGSKEFWASSSDGCVTHTLVDPEQETYVEKDFSTYESFATLSSDDDRYLPTLPVQRALGMVPVMSGNTIAYGLYPQTNVNNETLLNILNELDESYIDENGWYLYEGTYYAKAVAEVPSTTRDYCRFDNGGLVTAGETYWFTCEPIVWKILTNNSGQYYLLSSVLLDTQCYYHSQLNRTINSKTVYPNNYMHSDVRAWLNSEFLNSAFALNDDHVLITTVINTAVTTGGVNNYACPNTEDKIFLPSYVDFTNESYGFTTTTSTTDTRQCRTTDWTRARGAHFINKSYFASYWTRSPHNNYPKNARDIFYNGNISDVQVNVGAEHIDGSRYPWCVRPAITFSF